jgi:hypothetical protein
VLAAGAGLPAPARSEDPAALRFERDGARLKALSLGEIKSRCGEQRVQVPADPYYSHAMTYLASPLACVIEQGFGRPVSELRSENILDPPDDLVTSIGLEIRGFSASC